MSEKVNWLAKYGPRMLANSWPLVLLGYKSKKPLMPKWTNHRIDRGELKVRLAHKQMYGIGIQCGNIVGLDNDYEEGGAVTKEFLVEVEKLQAHFFPKVLKRKGRAARPPLQVFRLQDGAVAKSGDVGKVQIIGKGRQFVAYNIHPETDEPYRWLKVAWRGDQGSTPASVDVLTELPAYSERTLAEFKDALQLLEETWELTDARERGNFVDRLKTGHKPTAALRGDQQTVTRACEYLTNPEEWGWEEWNNRIMMPLWNASGGEDWGLDLAHKVSSQHPLYDELATTERWQAIAGTPPQSVGVGTLLWWARHNGMPYLGPSDWNDYKVFNDRDQVLNASSAIWTTRQMFNDLFNGQKAKGSTPLQTFIAARPEQVYSTILWDPTIPAGDVLDGGRKVWNTCVLPSEYGQRGNIQPWLDIMHNIYGDQHFDIILKRMAFDVQYPQLKPQWHELIIGAHGVGKNLTKAPLRIWYEQAHMAKTINSTEVESSFNSYVKEVKHLEIEEIAGMNSRIFNKLKSMLASMDPYYVVNEKFLRPYRMRNVISAWLSTNEIDAVTISPTERRLYVVHKHDKPLPKNERVKIFNWVKSNWQHVIYHLKNDVEVDANYGNLLPLETSDMLQLVDIAGRAHDRLRQVVREATRGVDVFHIGQLHLHLVSANIYERPGIVVSEEMVRRAVVAAGAMRCNHGNPVRVNGSLMRLYTFNADIANDANAHRAAQRGWMTADPFKKVVTDTTE